MTNDNNVHQSLTITICGGSNSGHVAAAYLASKQCLKVNVLTRKPDKWSNEISLIISNNSLKSQNVVKGLLNIVTDEPQKVIPTSDIVIIAAPANAHLSILQNISKHFKCKTILGCLYCQGGFDWAVKKAVPDLSAIDGFFGLLTIPWVCKTLEYGKTANLYGSKKKLFLAAWPPKNKNHYAIITNLLFDIPTETVPNFLTLTLSPSNQIIHPARTYALFKDWDGKRGYDKTKLPKYFYGGFDSESAHWLGCLDQELQNIKIKLCRLYKDLDLTEVRPIAERIILQYGDDVKDKRNLEMIFRTNVGYAACLTPTEPLEDNDKVSPAVNSRYFWEDIPYGLCVLKSIAQMAQVRTPTIDLMIKWHQKHMNKTYLDEETNLLNKNLQNETGAPECYGLDSLDKIIFNSIGVYETI